MKARVHWLGVCLFCCVSCSVQQPQNDDIMAGRGAIVLSNRSTVDLRDVSITYADTVLRCKRIPSGSMEKWKCPLHPMSPHLEIRWRTDDGRTPTNGLVSIDASADSKYVYELQFGSRGQA